MFPVSAWLVPHSAWCLQWWSVFGLHLSWLGRPPGHRSPGGRCGCLRRHGRSRICDIQAWRGPRKWSWLAPVINHSITRVWYIIKCWGEGVPCMKILTLYIHIKWAYILVCAYSHNRNSVVRLFCRAVCKYRTATSWIGSTTVTLVINDNNFDYRPSLHLWITTHLFWNLFSHPFTSQL